ncbi:MAG: putative thiamine biosynthesis lipoprotein [Subtercola sp.]|nr:putative thiamine biosynthesis lipoprotein [Subtercola sp.]
MTVTERTRPTGGSQTAAAEWPLWSTSVRVVVTDPGQLDRASTLVSQVLDDVGRACDRFSATSELNRLHGALAGGAQVSDTLALLVRTALSSARLTDGDVDPTLGDALAGLGYDRDIMQLPGLGGPSLGEGLSLSGRSEVAALRVGKATDARDPRVGKPTDIGEPSARDTVMTLAPRVPGWTRISLDGNRLTVPADLSLDLGATAKALAADRAAARVIDALGCGVLVSLGGDIATAGPAPAEGWQVTVHDLPGDPSCQITLAAGQALATSSTQKRRWQQRGQVMHHILDPRHGLPAAPVWRTVTVAASSCVRANTVSTASIVRGYQAIAWLARRGTTARLVNHDGRVLSLGGWPDENSVHVRQAS